MHTLIDAPGAEQGAPDGVPGADPDVTPPRRRSRVGLWCSTVWMSAVLAASVLADVLPLADPEASDYEALNKSPGLPAHLLGTDQLGRDTLSRIVFGSRVSLTVSLVAILASLLVGGVVGIVAGYRRRRVEAAVLVVSDAVLALPPIIFIMVVVAVVGASYTSLVISLAVVFLPTYIRLTRATTLSVATRDFVTAARASGATHLRVMWREVAPNVALPVAAYSVIAVSTAIVAEGTLSFLGLGIPPPAPSWGGMIAAGLNDLEQHPHISLVPAAVMFLTVFSLNVIGDALRARLDDRNSTL